jgi:hypothetical protein
MAKKENDNPFEVIIGFVILFGLGYLIFSKVLPAVGGFLFTKPIHKEICGESSLVINAKTDAAAKLAYKSCLRGLKD